MPSYPFYFNQGSSGSGGGGGGAPEVEYRFNAATVNVVAGGLNDFTKAVTVPDGANGIQIFGQIEMDNFIDSVAMTFIVDGQQLHQPTAVLEKDWTSGVEVQLTIHGIAAALAAPGAHTVTMRFFNNSGVNAIDLVGRTLKIDMVNLTQFDIEA